MIETQFYILGNQEYKEAKQDADQLGISVDYYISEFCTYEWEWVEISD